MALIDVDGWRKAVGADPEFRLAARYWNATLRVVMGADALLVKVRDGELREIDRAPTPFDAFDVDVAGPEEDWQRFLEPVPKPFYQDLMCASLHHGFRIGGDLESFFAYYAAAQRMFELMRAHRSG